MYTSCFHESHETLASSQDLFSLSKQLWAFDDSITRIMKILSSPRLRRSILSTHKAPWAVFCSNLKVFPIYLRLFCSEPLVFGTSCDEIIPVTLKVQIKIQTNPNFSPWNCEYYSVNFLSQKNSQEKNDSDSYEVIQK